MCAEKNVRFFRTRRRRIFHPAIRDEAQKSDTKRLLFIS